MVEPTTCGMAGLEVSKGGCADCHCRPGPEKVDTYRGPWESFTFFVNAHPDFVELLHVAGPILHILAVGIWDNHIEGIKQMCEGYIISAVDEAVTERD